MIVGASPKTSRGPRGILVAGTCVLLGCFAAGCGSQEPEQASPTARFDAVRFEEGLLAIETWLEKGRPVQAEQIARRLVELDPDSIDALEAHGRCLVILAALEAREGRSDGSGLNREALERYRSAIASAAGTPPHASLLHAAGLAAQAVGEDEEALEYHERAASIDTTNPQHPIFVGNLLAKLERPAEAATWFTRATEVDPREAWGWAGLAETRRQVDEHDSALEAIRTARRHAPSNVSFRVAEARILRESSRGREAAMLLFAIQPAERATPAVTGELAAACTQIGEHGRAAQAWEALHSAQPERIDASVNAAFAWIRAGEPGRAASWLEAAEAAGATPAQLEKLRSQLREQQLSTSDQPR